MKPCPECHEPLIHKKHKIFHCWLCPEGHGTLYPKGELEKIIGELSDLGRLEMSIWNDRERYSVGISSLISPQSREFMLEITDKQFVNIMVYADPVTHDLWLHSGEEEKLLEHIERQTRVDSVAAYLQLAAQESIKVFDDDEPLGEAAGHAITALKLLGERLLRAVPFISF